MCRETWLWVLDLGEGNYSSLGLQLQTTFSEGWQEDKWEEHSDQAIHLLCLDQHVTISAQWRKLLVAGLKAVFRGEVQVGSNLVHHRSCGGCLFDAERDPPHLISACNTTAVTSDDNTGVTNDCDLIKRDKRQPPAEYRHSSTMKTGLVGSVTHLSHSGF